MQIKSRPPKAKLMSLYFLSWIYKSITSFRNLLFNYIKICTSSVPCMVISVGNITTGGTGKTPLTIFLASSLRDKGYTVAILSRGYLRNTSGTVLVSKGNGPICSWEECGDEAYMIANHTSSLPIVVDNKRIRGAKYLLTMFSPDIIVLDDGFQHRSISRDLDILLINGSDKLDDHRLLPLGKLRESWHNAKRSDILIITKRNPAINIAEKIKYLNKPTFRTKSKNYISNDFLVRQLYYPFKLWSGKIQKKIRPIFLTYTNGIFHLREYSFTNQNHYNSIFLVKHKKYVVQDGVFNIEVLLEIIDKTRKVKEPEISFPQANSIERVINLCELLKQKGFLSKEEITQNYDFDSRQTDYYINAGRYLGLIEQEKDPETNKIGCVLSQIGKRIFNLNILDRQKEFVKLIVSHNVFKQTLKICLENGEMPTNESIVEIMKSNKVFKIESDNTYLRRASTINRWLNWILSLIEE